MKRKFLRYFCLIATSFSLLACGGGNSKEEISEYQHDHYTHWAYDKDCNKVNDGPHTFNSDHKCSVCGYEDPILLVNEEGKLLGLTEHGKTLEKITLTDNVYFIDNNAFEGSNAKKIHISKNVFGMGSKAHDFITSIEYETEGQVPELIKEGDGYFVPDLFLGGFECFTKDKKYSTLGDALADLTENNTIIYLLKENVSIPNKVEVALETTIVNTPEHVNKSKIIANDDLVINASGIVDIGEKVEFDGHIDLKLREIKGNYTTGAVAFKGLSSAPANTIVRYTSDTKFNEDKLVRGACQTRNKAILFPVDYYSYGTLEFSNNFYEITGLSPYGRTCTSLTLTSPLIGKDAIISQGAFTERYNKTIKIISTFVDFTMWIVDGCFTHLTIGDGIVMISNKAFYSYIETKLSESLNKFISLVFCHLKTLTIGDTCEVIQSESFGYSYKLTTINGSCSNLKEINCDAFLGSRELKSVNLANASNLMTIDKSFTNCNLLSSVILPMSNGWTIGSDTFLYEDLTPEHVAKYCIDGAHKITRNIKSEGLLFAVYNSLEVDKYGVPNKVKYYSTFENALKDTKDNDVIKLLSTSNDFKGKTFSVNNNISIDCSKYFDSKVSLKCDFFVKTNSYIKFTNKIDYEGKITLDNSNSPNLNNSAGVTFEYSNNVRNDTKANVIYNHFEDLTPISFQTAINSVKYTSYGLYNFNIVSNLETITSLTSLGKIMTSLVITPSFINHGVSIGETAFANNKTIKDLSMYYVMSLGEGCFKDCEFEILTMDSLFLTEIPKYAFQNCKNIKELDISHLNSLNRIGSCAFQGCGFTNTIVHTYFGWKYNGVSVSEETILDGKKLSTMLTNTHSSGTWTINGIY